MIDITKNIYGKQVICLVYVNMIEFMMINVYTKEYWA